MKVMICVDYSSGTEAILQAANLILGTRVPQADVTVVHILDIERIIGGKESEQAETNRLKEESRNINELAKQHLGHEFVYVEEYGDPKKKIEEMLNGEPYDMLIIGMKGKSMLANVLMGSVAEYLLHHVKKPMLIIPG